MEENLYESSRLLAEYLLFHYGSSEQTLGDFPGPAEATNFPVRLVRELLDPDHLETVFADGADRRIRALDIGCAVGASSFALSEIADEVLGIDFSRSFIDAARRLQATGLHDAGIVYEGKKTVPFRAMVPSGARRERVSFEVGDAMNLREDLGSFSIVVAANLICRLPDPRIFLERLPGLLEPGGQLLLTTPFTWMEEFTPAENWLGAQAMGPDSFSVLERALAPAFELAARVEIPFLLREHQRKFQYTVACGSRWVRKQPEP